MPVHGISCKPQVGGCRLLSNTAGGFRPPAIDTPHGHLQLLGIYRARAICVKEIKGFPAQHQKEESCIYTIPGASEAGMHRSFHQERTQSLQANLISCFCSSVKPCCFPFFRSLRAAVTAFLYELCRAIQQPSPCKYAACQRKS